MVFAGTYVASGSGLAVVVATGSDTRLGTIARLTGEVRRRPTPLRLQLNRAVRVIASFALAAGAVFFAISLALGTPARDGFLFAVGVIVALVPEGLLPTLSLSLAMSATRMAERGALERVELDTDHFKGNAPGRCDLEWCDAPGADADALVASTAWRPLVADTPLQPHARHAWDLPSRITATHVRLNIHPDGGVARLRLFGAVQG